MSEELQPDQEADQQANTGTSDLATDDAGENQGNKQSDKVEFTPEQQEVFDKAITRQHAKFRDAERATQETQAQLDKAQGRISDFEASQPKPVIPDAPDRLDFDTDAEYLAELAVRDAAIRADANFTQQQGFIVQAQQNDANDRVLAKQQQDAKNVQILGENATRLSIKMDDLVQASEVIKGYQLSSDLVNELLTHDDGPVMMAHLAANPLELDALRSLPPGQAFLMLHTTVLQGAQALKPKTSDAPPPPDVLSGNGARESDDRPMIAGATFE